MKAVTQYNDFIGTSSASEGDHDEFTQFIKVKNIDFDKYEVIGIEFNSTYDDSFEESLICLDKEKSKGGVKYYIRINFEKNISRDEFFNLFKSFSVVLNKNGYDSIDIKEDISI